MGKNQISQEKKKADFMVKQQQGYSFKKAYARIRAHEFENECYARGLNFHVSVGGLDSITLFLFLKDIGIDAPGISVSSLEDTSIQKMHRALGIERLGAAKDADGVPWTKPRILQEFGFPVISKETAKKIEALANPTEKNKDYRHAIVTGQTGERGGFKVSKKMKMAQKWLKKFGGYANEVEGTSYNKPDFKVSAKCCYYLKEKPCDDWAKEHNSVPFMGIMASEGGLRAKGLMVNGCNYFGVHITRSAPFAIFYRDDLLRLAREMDQKWKDGWKEEFYQKGVLEGYLPEGYEMPESIVPEIYGEIAEREDGTLYTTKAQRTGCSMCGFGIHLEKPPHRFDQLRERNPKEWQFWLYECCTDENGQKYGWAKVLDYIGVPYEKGEKPQEE